ncbi:acetyltransferase [Alkalihalobacillus sp. MEB130]|uniref:acetyltransferase n=1 Tax=Alkalihalobacillus sp. MEB130 TaxID=2976704 RepID=UPI0028DF45FD|nr:acetyltransferase [Alkalihalobacillus sp. MEB130]MDT8861102.1 acetyltransferase [Alkalihalobacillus sp. MEB130]
MKVMIIGQGGHSKVLYDLITTNKEMEVVGYLDDKYHYFTREDDLYVGPVSSAEKITEYFEDIKYIIGIGDNHVRKKIVEKLQVPEEKFISLIHPSALVSPSARIGHGSVILPFSIVNAGSEIGNHTIVNTRSIVEHDCILEDFVHVSPNATVTGTVEIEEGAHIGASATIIPNIHIGAWSKIGAGASVISDVPKYSTVVGIPAKLKMKEGDKLVQ